MEIVVAQYLEDGILYEFSNGGPVFTDGHLFYVDIKNEKLGKSLDFNLLVLFHMYIVQLLITFLTHFKPSLSKSFIPSWSGS